MKQKNTLPKVEIKKINVKKFVKLAKKVKKSFEEEEEYVRKNENTNRSKFTYTS